MTDFVFFAVSYLFASVFLLTVVLAVTATGLSFSFVVFCFLILLVSFCCCCFPTLFVSVCSLLLLVLADANAVRANLLAVVFTSVLSFLLTTVFG